MAAKKKTEVEEPEVVDALAMARQELPSDEPELLPPAVVGSGALMQEGPIDIDLSTLRPPYMQIAYGVGKLAENFNPGDLVLAREYCLASRGDKPGLEVIILNLTQFQKEYLSREAFTAGERPRVFATKQEASAAGLQTEWIAGRGPEVSPACEMTLLIRKPDDVSCDIFALNMDGGEWAIARCGLDKTAYAVFMKDAGITLKYKLKDGIYGAKWNFWTEMSQPSRSGNTTPVIRAQVKEFLPKEEHPKLIECVMG